MNNGRSSEEGIQIPRHDCPGRQFAHVLRRQVSMSGRGVTRIHSQIVLDKLKARGKFVPIDSLRDSVSAPDPR